MYFYFGACPSFTAWRHFEDTVPVHFVQDEADILADRIAIMSTGYLRCCGSSLFLKQYYGVGYTFTVSLKIGADPLASKEQIDPIVLESVRGSSSLSMAGGEVSYRLPFERTASFPDVFEELEQRKGDLGVSTYGISITTLEEVFLKIGEEHKDEIEGVDEDESDSDESYRNPMANEDDAHKLRKTPKAKDATEIVIGDDVHNPMDVEEIKIKRSLERRKVC